MKQTQTLISKSDVDTRVLAKKSRNLFPFVHLFLMECAILLVAVVLPLRGLFFYQAFPMTQLGFWLLLPTRLLFPGKASIFAQRTSSLVPSDPLPVAWQETGMMFVSLIVLVLFYLLAIRLLPKYIRYRYILVSTLMLGMTYVFIPITTSQDIFSYIGYARMGVVYHLNPLTTLPTAIRTDPVYPYIFWVHQPSAYGPTWAIITCVLQWFALTFGSKHILSMTLLLRLFGLAMHLGSVQLLWSLSGYLQRFNGTISPRTRLTATLAFAWNPLLLFEACVNAHNDTTVLFLLLLALCTLQLRPQKTQQPYLLAAVLLALVACLKITFVLLAPGLLLFLWTQPRRVQNVTCAALVYISTIILLYAPFWQHGAILHVFQVNPGTTRDINSPYEFLIHFYDSMKGRAVPVIISDIGSPIEITTHKISMVVFVIIYGAICLWSLVGRQRVNTILSLIRWMALVWFLYCLLGSPWFWPWYITVFFGLAALILATSPNSTLLFGSLRLPLVLNVLTLSMLCTYCFFTWAPYIELVPLHHLPYFRWSYLRGLWAWGLLILAINPYFFLPLWKGAFFRRKPEKTFIAELHPDLISSRKNAST